MFRLCGPRNFGPLKWPMWSGLSAIHTSVSRAMSATYFLKSEVLRNAVTQTRSAVHFASIFSTPDLADSEGKVHRATALRPSVGVPGVPGSSILQHPRRPNVPTPSLVLLLSLES